MLETTTNQIRSDESYIHAVTRLRNKCGNYRFLNQIIKHPNETKFILQNAGSNLFFHSLPFIVLGITVTIIAWFGFFQMNGAQQIILILCAVIFLVSIFRRIKKVEDALTAASQIAYNYGKI